MADVGAGLPQPELESMAVGAPPGTCAPTHRCRVGDLLPLADGLEQWCPLRLHRHSQKRLHLAQRSRTGQFSDCYHRLKGSEWDPWEWRLMRSRRCQLVAMRDRLTARGLQRKGVAPLRRAIR